jgi:hypothetical protein
LGACPQKNNQSVDYILLFPEKEAKGVVMFRTMPLIGYQITAGPLYLSEVT